MKTTIRQWIIIVLNVIAIFSILPIIEKVNTDKALFALAWFIFFLLLINTYFMKYGITITHLQKVKEEHPKDNPNSFLSLYLKRKKLEQLAKIKELEEKTKSPNE